MPSIRLVTGNPALAETDVLVVPAFDGEALAEALPALDAATSGEVRRATSAGEFRGRPGDFFLTPAQSGGWKAARIALAVLIATCILEFLQLWHPPLLEWLRSFFIGRTILGSYFDWSDFPYYFIGSALGWLWLRVIGRRQPLAARVSAIPSGQEP